MNNAVFEKTIKNARKRKDIKLALTEARRKYQNQTIKQENFFRKITSYRNKIKHKHPRRKHSI